jgi:glycosyltransferase involved in cell wall biosynthesis
MKQKVSINLCCYNSEKYLRETLESIVNQTYKDWELVIINDGSSDSTESIISEYIKQGYPIIYHYQENRGLGASRNRAIKISQGEYIAFIDHDDIWLPQKLEKQIELFIEKPRLGAIYTDCYYIDSSGSITGRWFEERQPYQGRVFNQLLLEEFFMPIQTLIVQKEVLEKVGLFNASLNIAEDNDINLKIAYQYEIGFIPEPLVGYRIHEGCSSKDYFTLSKEQYLVSRYWQRLAKEKKLSEKDLINDVFLYKCKKMFYLSISHKRDFKTAFKYILEAFSIYDSKFENIQNFISGIHVTSMQKLKIYRDKQ